MKNVTNFLIVTNEGENMNRTDYLELCRKVSVLQNGICGVKKDVPAELQVELDGIAYYPQSYELAFQNGNVLHFAILHDLNTNSITKCRLDKVGRVKGRGE